jgi:glycopeptide antibiotics resistance protein
VVMNYVAVPLSEIGRIPQFTSWTFSGNVLAMLGFGLLIAFFARGAFSE